MFFEKDLVGVKKKSFYNGYVIMIKLILGTSYNYTSSCFATYFCHVEVLFVVGTNDCFLCTW